MSTVVGVAAMHAAQETWRVNAAVCNVAEDPIPPETSKRKASEQHRPSPIPMVKDPDTSQTRIERGSLTPRTRRGMMVCAPDTHTAPPKHSEAEIAIVWDNAHATYHMAEGTRGDAMLLRAAAFYNALSCALNGGNADHREARLASKVTREMRTWSAQRIVRGPRFRLESELQHSIGIRMALWEVWPKVPSDGTIYSAVVEMYTDRLRCTHPDLDITISNVCTLCKIATQLCQGPALPLA